MELTSAVEVRNLLSLVTRTFLRNLLSKPYLWGRACILSSEAKEPRSNVMSVSIKIARSGFSLALQEQSIPHMSSPSAQTASFWHAHSYYLRCSSQVFKFL